MVCREIGSIRVELLLHSRWVELAFTTGRSIPFYSVRVVIVVSCPDGLKLSIPEGAVLSKSVINIKAGLAGQFQLPSDAQLVSPMYWLYCDYSFQNPIMLELQHCTTINNSFLLSCIRVSAVAFELEIFHSS